MSFVIRFTFHVSHTMLALFEPIEDVQPRLICKRVAQFSCFGQFSPDSAGIPSCTSRIHDGQLVIIVIAQLLGSLLR